MSTADSNAPANSSIGKASAPVDMTSVPNCVSRALRNCLALSSSAFTVSEQVVDALLKLAPSDRKAHPTFKQNRTKLIYQVGPFSHQTGPRAV